MIAKWPREVTQSRQIYARYFYWALPVLWAASSLGRKPLEQEIIQLILAMKRLNPVWGGQRISDELAKIGYSASKVTVLKYLKIYGLHHPPENLVPSWREFINAAYSPGFEWVKQQFRNAFFNMDGKHPALGIGVRGQIFQGHFEQMIKDYIQNGGVFHINHPIKME